MAKTVLVTGATDGIGRQAALDLARQGAHVLVHGRDAQKGQAVVAALRAAAPQSEPRFFQADFASLAEVAQLAEAISDAEPRLEVQVNNAGLFSAERRLSRDGLELTFAVNHLAPMLLTLRLLDRLKASAPARIVTVSSALHRGATVDFDNLQGEKGYNGSSAYALSKLGNLLFTFALARRLESARQVTANALHPGGVATKLLRAGWGAGGVSVEKGAETPVYLALSPEVESRTGEYWAERQPAEASPASRDVALQESFWRVSQELIAQALG